VTTWQGVIFGTERGADAGRVVGIQLMNSYLTGDVPAVFGGLTALKSLELSGNNLTSVPVELGGLTALKTLDLGGNQLTTVPAELGGLTALKILNLHGIQLTSLPEALGWARLTMLIGLDLSQNQLTSVPTQLGALTALKMLYLDGNPLTSVPAELKEGGALEKSGCVIVRNGDENDDDEDNEDNADRGLHSLTPQLLLSAFYGKGGARRGCVAHVKGVLGGV
jgi:Leucine-rich repeat (LRR) protein